MSANAVAGVTDPSEAGRTTGRVAVVVPPANPTVEPEMTDMLPHALALHATRFPVFEGWDQQQRNQGYLDSEPAAARAFGNLALDGLFVACTGSHYLLEPGADAQLCDRLSADSGLPVRAATLTITDTLRDVGARSIYVVSPYDGWLTELSHKYWEAAGFPVAGVVEVRAAGGSPYDVSPQAMAEKVEQAGLPKDAVILFTGTGMPTLDAIEALGRGNDRVVISSNLTGARWLTEIAGLAPVHPALKRLQHHIVAGSAS